MNTEIYPKNTTLINRLLLNGTKGKSGNEVNRFNIDTPIVLN